MTKNGETVSDIPLATIINNPIIWSGLIGASVALFSAILLGIFNAWHSSREKSRDRTATLRKEVYLPLVASLPAVWSSLAKMPSSSEFDEKPMAELSACANKLAIVAEMRTSTLATELAAFTSAAMFDLMKAAIPAHKSLSDIDIAKEYRIKSSEKADLAQAKVDELLQNGIIDDAKFNALTSNLKFHHENAQKYWDQEIAAREKHLACIIAYLRKLLKLLPKLESLRVDLFIALRNDIKIKTSENDFKNAMESQAQLIIENLESFIFSFETKNDEDLKK